MEHSASSCPRKKRVTLSLVRDDDLGGPAKLKVVAERDARFDALLALNYGDGTTEYVEVPRGSRDYEVEVEHRFRQIPGVGYCDGKTVVWTWTVFAFMDGYDVDGDPVRVRQTRLPQEGDEPEEEEPFRLPPEFLRENPL